MDQNPNPARLVDTFGRAITYMRISVTDRCNLRCVYCLPEDGVKWLSEEETLSPDEIVQVVKTVARMGVNKIRLTGGEPLVRPEILEIIRQIAEVKEINDLCLTTNGMLLEKLAEPLAKAGLHRVNISLDTLDPEKFKKVTRFGDLSRVWKGIQAAEQAGLTPVKLNAVIVGGFNDDEIIKLASLSSDHPWHVRFIELMPFSNEQNWRLGYPEANERYISVQKMHDILQPLQLEPVLIADTIGPERTFKIPGAPGTVGFISPIGENFCNQCNRLRLTAGGLLRSCLLVDHEISIKEALNSGENLENYLIKAVQEKPEGHQVRQHQYPSSLCMSQIGG